MSYSPTRAITKSQFKPSGSDNFPDVVNTFYTNESEIKECIFADCWGIRINGITYFNAYDDLCYDSEDENYDEWGWHISNTKHGNIIREFLGW